MTGRIGEWVGRLSRHEGIRGSYALLRRIPGVSATVQKLVRRALPMGSRVWVTIPGGLAKGMRFQADPRYELGYLHGDHEPWVQELLEKQLECGSCFYDIGAHTGFFAVIAAHLVGPSGSVIAFEPDPEVAMILRQNVARNKISLIKVIEAGVWSSAGSLSFQRA